MSGMDWETWAQVEDDFGLAAPDDLAAQAGYPTDENDEEEAELFGSTLDEEGS